MEKQILIKVTPGAKEDLVIVQSDGSLRVRVTAPPDKGKANQAVIDLLAKHFNVPKRCILIKSGHTSKQKLVLIELQT